MANICYLFVLSYTNLPRPVLIALFGVVVPALGSTDLNSFALILLKFADTNGQILQHTEGKFSC